MTFDPTKPVRTRDGRAARIVCADAKRKDSLIALVECAVGEETLLSYFPDGSSYMGRQDGLDLINIPKRTVRYIALLNPTGFVRATDDPKYIPEDFPGRSYLKVEFEGDCMVAVELIRPEAGA